MKKNLFLFIIMFLLLFTNCGNLEENSLKKQIIYPDFIQYGYRHNIYKNGRKFLTTSVKQAKFFEKLAQIKCYNIKATIYNSKGEVTTTIKSAKCLIDKKKKSAKFADNVVFEMKKENATIFAEVITLDYKNNKLTSDKPIQIKKEDGSFLNADGLESDIKEENTEFKNMELKYFYDKEKENSD